MAVTVACATTIAAQIQGGLTPAFDPSVPDYTVKCSGAPLEVSGRLAQGASISVDGGGSEARHLRGLGAAGGKPGVQLQPR